MKVLDPRLLMFGEQKYDFYLLGQHINFNFFYRSNFK